MPKTKTKEELKLILMDRENRVQKSPLAIGWDLAKRAACAVGKGIAGLRDICTSCCDITGVALLTAIAGATAGNVWFFTHLSPYGAIPCALASLSFLPLFKIMMDDECADTIGEIASSAIKAAAMSAAFGLASLGLSGAIYTDSQAVPDSTKAVLAIQEQSAWKKGMTISFGHGDRAFTGTLTDILQTTTGSVEDGHQKETYHEAEIQVPYQKRTFWTGDVQDKTLTVRAKRTGAYRPAAEAASPVSSSAAATQPATP